MNICRRMPLDVADLWVTGGLDLRSAERRCARDLRDGIPRLPRSPGEIGRAVTSRRSRSPWLPRVLSQSPGNWGQIPQSGVHSVGSRAAGFALTRSGWSFRKRSGQFLPFVSRESGLGMVLKPVHEGFFLRFVEVGLRAMRFFVRLALSGEAILQGVLVELEHFGGSTEGFEDPGLESFNAATESRFVRSISLE